VPTPVEGEARVSTEDLPQIDLNTDDKDTLAAPSGVLPSPHRLRALLHMARRQTTPSGDQVHISG
jgi:hypothetical protein